MISLQIFIWDESHGLPFYDLSWEDIRDDDYLLAELLVFRVLGSDETWNLRFCVVAATRVATTP